LAHVNGELFKMMTGTNLVHVPYRSAAAVMTPDLGERWPSRLVATAEEGGLSGLGKNHPEGDQNSTGVIAMIT
jgi:hypothetical protein